MRVIHCLWRKMKYQKDRFDDLQKAYSTLEKSVHSGANKIGVKWDNSTLNERDR